MISEEARGRIAVVLGRARNPGNIGAVARAMQDFGFGRLRVVNEFRVPFEGARSAVDAGAVLLAAEEFGTVAEAVGDCDLGVGTTAGGERVIAQPVLTLPEASGRIGAVLAGSGVSGAGSGAFRARAGARVALLFGSEKTGLSNEELSHCHWLLTIPMQERAAGERHLSMNLGQATAVCLYELVREAGGPGTDAPGLVAAEALALAAGALAPAAETERLGALLGEMLDETEYRRHHPANSDDAAVRRLVLRMGLSGTDAQVWMGIVRQVLWRLRSMRRS